MARTLPTPVRPRATTARTVAVGVTGLALAGCSVAGTGAAPDEASSGPGSTVTLVTHESFAVDEDVLAAFEERSGLTVEIVQQGDGGALVNQLVLTRESPLGDAVFGIDNSFASRAIDEGVVEPYVSPELSAGAAALAPDDAGHLSAVDLGDVCVNVDHTWFAERGIPEPVTLQDLTEPAYRDLLVVQNPATSSPGLSFLLATVGAFGEDGWTGYWQALRDNGVRVVDGWSDAYTVDFSGSSGAGPRPLVVSYASSPPAEVPEGATQAPTGALLDTCFRQVEYAGVLAGTDNPEGAREVVDFLLGAEFQAGVPEQMYMYPADDHVALPPAWQAFAPLSPQPFTVAPDEIDAHRDEWIRTWTDTVVG
ncbi:thiamine ABC transporter substrate-binding protein [Cellulomonas aerilata]|uniref:Thiamine ABC transporter substrate-binding protein n=1 Tax=Cellulomonas aerilata TaxID=515326 RepID=A0A512D7X8_9CELL|nr:thiamine ABC transporter substrate-binding protein [Cellulomonas aerilata]GEO32612.1 thiamine ABC transporter substrate-binding protein [Cellulomonas aerilata]